ncbi:glycosyltransferase involved in cell wall biosynthesis [Bacilli bacterium PM5-9]|nr:glycosyltransferase involved in cell wall biosynthesis [Bacilli bacterium PM5-9]
MFKIKSKKIIGIGFLIFVCIGGLIFGFIEYKKEDIIKKEIASIEIKVDKMKQEKNRDKKVAIYKEINDDCIKYSKNKNSNSKVINFYNTTLSDYKKSIGLQIYDNKIIENTISNVSKAKQKDLNIKIKDLKSLKNMLKKEKSLFLSDSEYSDYISKVDKLLKDYDKQLKVIKDKEQSYSNGYTNGDNSGSNNNSGGNDGWYKIDDGGSGSMKDGCAAMGYNYVPGVGCVN